MKAFKLSLIALLFTLSVLNAQVTITTGNPSINLPNQWPAGNSWNMLNTVYTDLINLGAASSNTANGQFTTISPLVATTGVTITGQRAYVISDSSIASVTLTIAQSGSRVLLKALAGDTVVLPASSAANVGATYTVEIAYSATSVGHTIKTSGTDVFYGGVIVGSSTTCLMFASTANKTMAMSTTTTGGLKGTCVTFTLMSGGRWATTGILCGSGSVATPFTN